MPASRKKYWRNKIERNKIRDKEVNRFYKKTGWQIIRIWEHEIKKDLNKVVLNTIHKIKNHEIH
jgi:DNA mismatch endonuclease (patch repair protein)